PRRAARAGGAAGRRDGAGRLGHDRASAATNRRTGTCPDTRTGRATGTGPLTAQPAEDPDPLGASQTNPSGSVNGPASLPITRRCEPSPSGGRPAFFASALRVLSARVTGEPAGSNSAYLPPKLRATVRPRSTENCLLAFTSATPSSS